MPYAGEEVGGGQRHVLRFLVPADQKRGRCSAGAEQLRVGRQRLGNELDARPGSGRGPPIGVQASLEDDRLGVDIPPHEHVGSRVGDHPRHRGADSFGGAPKEGSIPVSRPPWYFVLSARIRGSH